MTPDTTVRHILTQMILNAKLIADQSQLQQILEETEPRLVRAITHQNLILSETQVTQHYPFLTVTALRNMRCRQSGPAYHKLGPHKNSRITYRKSDIEIWLTENHQRTH